MRYKAYVVQNYRSLHPGILVLARQGNDFVDARGLAGISNKAHPAYKTATVSMTNPKNCEELNDGVYFLKHKIGDIFVIPESNPFFTTGVLLDGLDAEPIYLQVRVKVLVIRYLRSLKS